MKLSLLLSSHRRRLWAPGGRDLVWSQFARSLCNISSVFACISCKRLAFYRLLVLSQRERKQEIDLGDNSPLVRKSKTVLNSGFKVLDFSFQWNLDSGFQSLVGCFWIPNPRISDSASKIFPDSGIHKQEFPRFWNPDSLTRWEIMS